MGRRGRKRQLAVENAYWQLIMAGVGTVEACQRLGITRKTGYRWPAERGGLPPLRVVEEERGPRYLSLLERRLATLRRTVLGVRAIAHELGRSPSTVSRDLALQGLVQAKLVLAPEHIAAWLRHTYPERRAWHVCHETIYQAIYHSGNRGLTRKLTAKHAPVDRCGSVAANRPSRRSGLSLNAA